MLAFTLRRIVVERICAVLASYQAAIWLSCLIEYLGTHTWDYLWSHTKKKTKILCASLSQTTNSHHLECTPRIRNVKLRDSRKRHNVAYTTLHVRCLYVRLSQEFGLTGVSARTTVYVATHVNVHTALIAKPEKCQNMAYSHAQPAKDFWAIRGRKKVDSH